MDDNKRIINKQILIKIGVPIIIVLIVAGIFFYKKDNQSEENAEGSLPLEISSIDLEQIKSYELPFVIDFGSDSCIPCRKMAPVLVTLHEDLQGKAIVHFVDVWKYTTAANDFPVTVIPTQIFYNAQGTPFVPSAELTKEIEFIIYRSKDTNEHEFTVHEGGLTEEQMRKIFAEMGVK